MRSFRLFALVHLLFSALPILAQNTVTIQSRFGSKDPSGIDPGCRQEANRFLQIAATLPHTTNWHYVIVCDEPSWSDFIQKSGQYEPGVEVFGTTYLQSHITFIRGWRLTHSGEPYVTPEHIVAHELAHILLNSADEVKVDKQAALWTEAMPNLVSAQK